MTGSTAVPEDTARTATVERVPDASVERLEAVWNEDWQRTVLAAALARVKAEANLKDCQMFELLALRGLSPREVARTLGVSTARVYLAKHRIAPLVKKRVAELERALEYPWDKWTVFLHPEQRQWVERSYTGPARVAGSAGTGKTNVALHRAVFLARRNPDSRGRLTPFSAPLAPSLPPRFSDELRREVPWRDLENGCPVEGVYGLCLLPSRLEIPYARHYITFVPRFQFEQDAQDQAALKAAPTIAEFDVRTAEDRGLEPFRIEHRHLPDQVSDLPVAGARVHGQGPPHGPGHADERF